MMIPIVWLLYVGVLACVVLHTSIAWSTRDEVGGVMTTVIMVTIILNGAAQWEVVSHILWTPQIALVFSIIGAQCSISPIMLGVILEKANGEGTGAGLTAIATCQLLLTVTAVAFLPEGAHTLFKLAGFE